jgi:hypothetical protein
MMIAECGINGGEQYVGKLDQPISCQKIITWNLVNAQLVMVDQKPQPIKPRHKDLNTSRTIYVLRSRSF